MWNEFVAKFERSKYRTLISAVILIVVILAATLIFVMRYRPAYQIPNFYAEDGRIFTNNILHKNIIASTLTGFNGYLVVGQYLILEVAVGMYKLFGFHFYQLSSLIAGVSYLFLGLTVSLPYILFRKQLGNVVALCAVAVGAFVAMPTYDYAIIGTIGNLKFAFLYWAVLLILYRHFHSADRTRVIIVDILLLICVLTNAPDIFLLPFILLPYRKNITTFLRTRKLKHIYNTELISGIILIVISVMYLLVVYLKGIPKLPGYLDTPYQKQATAKLLFRVTWYSWLFPIASTMRNALSVILITFFVVAGLIKRRSRFLIILGLAAILIQTVGFVVNRPGISAYFLMWGLNNPDQFFYAQNLVFIFLSFFLISKYFNSSNLRSLMLVIATLVFLLWSVPYGSSFGRNKVIYQNLGTAKADLAITCKQPSQNITFQIYPSAAWKWQIAKSIACN